MTRFAEGRLAGLLALAGAALALSAVGAAIELADVFPKLRFAVQRNQGELPSTQAVDPREVVRGLPLLSIHLQPDHLQELMEHKMEHGRQWERPATLSYFEEGRLRFAGEAGVRVHGGGSRITSPQQSFRVFFRRQYGTLHFAPGLLFGPESHPLQRLVVHNDVRRSADGMPWRLANPLAYDFARKIGCITPETRPARFFLNGEDQGLYVLTEHFDDEYFETHRPGRRVTMEIDDMEALRDRLEAIRPLRMEAVAEFLDLDNVTSWFLAAVFAASRDAYQGPGQFLDESLDRAGWFWVTWDLDESFRDWDLDSFQYLLERVGERPKGRRASEPRSFVLSTLISEDPEFRAYLAGRIDTMLNHQLTRDFVEERRAHYAGVAARFGVPDTRYIERQRSFLEKRPAFVRMIAEQWLNTPPSLPVSVRRADGGPLRVDGFDRGAAFDGSFFPGREITIGVPDGKARWKVNGVQVSEGETLRLRVDRPSLVIAATDRGDGAIDAAPPDPRPVGPPPGPPLEWRRMPASTFMAGCTPGDRLCEDNEQPVESVSVRSFELAATEVTVAQYGAYARETGSRLPTQPHWSDHDHPVVNLSWNEAAAYCGSIGGRLPTEAEWELAARGGENERYPAGEAFDPEGVNGMSVTGKDRWGFTAPVGSFPANGFGLHDMTGNVWEWTADWYREGPGWTQPTLMDPAPDSASYLKTVRGGSWDSSPRNLRITRREGLSAGGRHNLYVGIRCAR